MVQFIMYLLMIISFDAILAFYTRCYFGINTSTILNSFQSTFRYSKTWHSKIQSFYESESHPFTVETEQFIGLGLLISTQLIFVYLIWNELIREFPHNKRIISGVLIFVVSSLFFAISWESDYHLLFIPLFVIAFVLGFNGPVFFKDLFKFIRQSFVNMVDIISYANKVFVILTIIVFIISLPLFYYLCNAFSFPLIFSNNNTIELYIFPILILLLSLVAVFVNFQFSLVVTFNITKLENKIVKVIFTLFFCWIFLIIETLLAGSLESGGDLFIYYRGAGNSYIYLFIGFLIHLLLSGSVLFLQKSHFIPDKKIINPNPKIEL